MTWLNLAFMTLLSWIHGVYTVVYPFSSGHKMFYVKPRILGFASISVNRS